MKLKEKTTTKRTYTLRLSEQELLCLFNAVDFASDNPYGLRENAAFRELSPVYSEATTDELCEKLTWAFREWLDRKG